MFRRSLIRKIRRSLTKEQWSRLLVSCGLILFTISGDYRITQWNLTARVEAHQEHQEIAQQTLTVTAPQFTKPRSIVVPGLLKAPVETGLLIDGTWSLSQTHALFAEGSALPGETGNSIIYGHNFDHILGKLSQVKVNDIITITTTDGTIREYIVTEKSEVAADKTHYLDPTTEEVLTVYTCAGWMDTKRLVIRAVPKQ